MSQYDATPMDSDLWHVQLANGEVCTMTLDLLDDAFQDGIIDKHTYIWQEGSPDWVTLGDVAGLDEPDVIAPTYPAAGLNPKALANPFPLVASPYSTPPVVGDIRDIDFDLDDEGPYKKRRGSKLRWFAVAAVIGAACFGAVKRNELVERYRIYLPPSVAARLAGVGMTAAFTAAPPPPPPAPAATPTSAPEPAPTAAPAATPAPASTPSSATDSRFSDDQKRALLDADKTRAEKQKQKAKTRVAAPSSSPSPKPRKSENPFHNGGNRFDPLNSSL
jgi:hypothetical protein